MKMLSQAISSKLENFVAPKRGEGFEDLCLDIFEHVLTQIGVPIVGGPYARMVAHGVSGNAQNGVDIYDPATLAAAQCKNQADLTVSDLQKELTKLQGFGKPVSHYFFLLGREGVPTSMQLWVDQVNQCREDDSSRLGSAGGENAVVGPMVHIIGWPELKGFLFKSNFLMWKWGVAHPVIHQYPYLPTLDVKFLAETMEALNAKVDVPLTRRESKDAVAGLLRSVDEDGLTNLVANSRVEREVFAGLGEFIAQFQCALDVARTYSLAVTDVNSQDPIVMEQGFAAMNELARYLPRMSVLRYLRQVYLASRALLRVFEDEDSYDWDTVEVEHQGQMIDIEGDTTLLFNFNPEKQDWSRPYYVDPEHVTGLIEKIVDGVKLARQEIAEV